LAFEGPVCHRNSWWLCGFSRSDQLFQGFNRVFLVENGWLTSSFYKKFQIMKHLIEFLTGRWFFNPAMGNGFWAVIKDSFPMKSSKCWFIFGWFSSIRQDNAQLMFGIKPVPRRVIGN
jgi:hypothetical protein